MKAKVAYLFATINNKNHAAVTKKLKNFLKAVLFERLGDDEKAEIDKIRNLRGKLYISKEQIDIIEGYNAPESHYDKLYLSSTTVGSVTSISSMPSSWAIILYQVIREFKPTTCFEMGTCVGISGMYQALALKFNHNGSLTTFELSPSKVNIAINNFKELDFNNVETVCGKFQDTLKEKLLEKQPIDYIFIDGHHDGEATMKYFKLVLPYLSDNAIIVFDDINWSKSMKNTWNIIKKNNQLLFTLDLIRLGICIVGKHSSLGNSGGSMQNSCGNSLPD